MDVSILIVNWNTRDYLRDCLQSIRNTVNGISHEVIVVDNASEDKSADMVSKEFPDAMLIASRENLGFARGNNLAFSRSSGRYLLVTNPDIILIDDTVQGLVRFADSHPDAGIISPKLLNPDRTAQRYYGRIPTLSSVFFIYTRVGAWIDSHAMASRMRQRDRYEKYQDFKETLAFTDGGAAFCCTLIPRRLIEQIGFMDERFPVFFNDGDFALRLFRAGYRAYIIPQVQACHYGGSSVKQLDQLTYNKEWIYGLRTFYHKHRGLLYNLAIDTVLSLNILYDLSFTVKDILFRNKGPSEFLTPLTTYREILAYRPSNVPEDCVPKEAQD